MKQYIETYCQLSFLEQISNMQPKIDYPDTLNGHQAYLNLRQIIEKKSELLIDQYQDFEKKLKSNPYLKKLMKDSMTGGSNIHDFSKDFHLLLTDIHYLKGVNPSAIHYYDRQNIFTEKLCAELGIFINSKGSWKTKIVALSNTYSIYVSKNPKTNQFKGWEVLNSTDLPINAAVIVDPYILNNSRAFQYNIYSIIENILPKTLNQNTFHLTILISKDIACPQRQYEAVKNYIDSFKKTYSIEFGLYLVGNNNLVFAKTFMRKKKFNFLWQLSINI